MKEYTQRERDKISLRIVEGLIGIIAILLIMGWWGGLEEAYLAAAMIVGLMFLFATI